MAQRIADPARTWATQLERRRPGLVPEVLDGLAGLYGRPRWKPRLDPISELVTTILSQNTSDANAARAFAGLRERYADWAAVERAPVRQLATVIKSGGLAAQKAPRIKAALKATRLKSGDYDLEGLFIRLDHAIRSIGAKRVVLDTIETLFASLPNPAILRAELRRLFRWLKDRGVTAIITGERGDAGGDVHGRQPRVLPG